MKKWHQHAGGEFSAKVVPGTPHCGVQANIAQLKYAVLLSFGDNPLDYNGFLFDNTYFQLYFQEIGPIDCSCEKLAMRAAQHFLEDPRVVEVSVKIFPFSDVYVEISMDSEHGPVE